MSKQVVPSRMNLNLFKGKIVAAKKGYELLKKKCDALKTKFRVVMIELLEKKKMMGLEAQDALLLIAKAQWSAGEFHQSVRDSIKRASMKVEISSENIAGVQLPIMNLKETDDLDANLSQIGISRGGQTIQRTREKFKELLLLLIKIASSQTSFMTLDETIKVTNRRVNALEHLVIPNFIAVTAYIQQELDEQSREDYYRLKKVLDNKKRMIAEEALEKEKRMKEMEKEMELRGGKKAVQIEEDQEASEGFDKKDEDVIF